MSTVSAPELIALYEQQLGQLRWSFAAFLVVVVLCGGLLVGLLVRRVRMQAGSHVEAALAAMPQALCMVGADDRLVMWNARLLELFGLRRADVRAGQTMAEVRGAVGRAGRYGADVVEGLFTPPVQDGRKLVVLEDAGGRAISASRERVAGGGWVATFEDVTERSRSEARIRFMAHHDPLTGLGNRLQFGAALESALEDARAGRGTSVAVLCLDLDGFKEVNDKFGHPAGDGLLQAVAGRLLGCVREGDLVVRLGGDEFALLQVGAKQPESARSLAGRVVEELGRAHEIDGHLVFVGASVGIAVAGPGVVQGERLMKGADTALYCAKADGRGAYRMFEPAMDAMMQVRRTLEAELREALDHGELEVLFQPLFDLVRNKVCGFEAVLRWRHPMRGLLQPAAFVPIAEELGLMDAIGRWALVRACVVAAAWPAGMRLAAAVSPGQLSGPGLPGVVRQALDLSGLEPGRLELLITEGALMRDSGAVLGRLQAVCDQGVQVTFDRFGTGYASLSYLQSFPFRRVKMDPSFIEEIGFRQDCEALVRAIGDVALSLGMVLTAAGVETVEQVARLRAIGCAEVQGGLFDPPRPADEIGHWFAPGRDGRGATAGPRPGLEFARQEDYE